MTSRARSDVNAQVLGTILDLHLPKDWDMGANPFRKLFYRQIPVLDSVAFLVVEGHACDWINRREGFCHKWKGLTQRGRSESKVVSVGTRHKHIFAETTVGEVRAARQLT